MNDVLFLGRVVQVPYPSVGGWDGNALVPEAPPLDTRPQLAAVVANAFHNGGAFIGRAPLRKLLLDECANAGSNECQMLQTQAPSSTAPGGSGPVAVGLAVRGAGGTAVGAQSTMRTIEAYQHSKFCLMPWGDLATRKAFWDAIACGCIPAVFTVAGWNETDSWFGPHWQFSVHIPIAEVGVAGRGALAFLRAIPSSRVAALHKAVADARGRLTYSSRGSPPAPGDAVDTIVTSLQSELMPQMGDSSSSSTVEGQKAQLHADLKRYVCAPEFGPFAKG